MLDAVKKNPVQYAALLHPAGPLVNIFPCALASAMYRFVDDYFTHSGT